MKKKIFVFLSLFSLTLTGCSFSGVWNGFLEFIGIRKKTEPAQDEPSEEKEPWKLVYSSNAEEHWYTDEAGVEHRENHHFTSIGHTDKTCTHTEHEEFKCSDCGYVKIAYGKDLKEHVFKSVTTPATCSAEGKVVFTCENCDHVHEVALPINREAHNFVKKSEVDGVTTYECSLCKETKLIMDLKSQVTAENVSKEALQQVDEIQLQNASIAFDDSIFENDLGANVNIAAEAKKTETVVEELSLSSADQEKLQGKPIVDFSVTNADSEEKISEFSGTVKVTIPYEIKAGEDPEGIAIWYLSENNGPEAIKASYSNGNVSFETNHFSYYAVVHLTPEESCNKFGHEYVKGASAPSTCYAHGYDSRICRRCHDTIPEELPLAPHEYECVSQIQPTETTEGKLHYECKVCKESYDVVIPVREKTDRGFFVNLIHSMLTPDWSMYASTTENGVTKTHEEVNGLDFEGLPFSYSSDSSVLYKGYRYYEDYKRSRSYSSDPFDYDLVKELIDYIPQIYKNKVEEVGEWIVTNYLVKEETPEG